MTCVALITVLVASVMPLSEAKDQRLGTESSPSRKVDTVQSHGQAGGVTAGTIGTVNQVVPTLVRGPLLNKFKEAFAQGAKIRRHLSTGGQSDAEYNNLLDAADMWVDQTYSWLGHDFGEYAAERFIFRTSPTMIYTKGPTDQALNMRRNNTLSAMAGWLQNLDLLMREPSLYPEK